MKKINFFFTALLLTCTLSAQTHGTLNHNPHGTFPNPPQAPSILVQSQNYETFQVYIDGDLINNVPKSEVLISNLDTRLHEVVVILNHPAHKAVVTQLYAATPAPTLTVSYDMRRQQLLLYSSQNNGNYSPQPQGRHPHQHGQTTPPTPPTPPTHTSFRPHSATPEPATASDQWVDEMIAIINDQSFDSEKLSTAKNLLYNEKPFTASQIARIAQTLNYGSSQVDFLKAAYRRCADPQNYEHALAVLTFSSDREAVRAFINTQR